MDLEYHKYRTNEIEKNLDSIILDSKKKRLNKLKPLKKDVDRAFQIIREYIKLKKRVIYGGMAINELIKLKNPQDAIYDDKQLDYPDYDIYTPEPIYDMIYITNKLYDLGFKDINARESIHEGSYTIRLDNVTGVVLDLTYVWQKHYNYIPKRKIGDLFFIDYDFAFIDLYKMCTDPLLAFEFRINKAFHRVSLLEYYYPITARMSLFCPDFFDKPIKNIEKINNILMNQYIKNNDDIIVSGLIPYNIYMEKIDNTKVININYISVITENIEKTSNEIINLLINNNLEKSKLTIKKYHKLFEIFDTRILIFYENKIICSVMRNMNRCIPYITVNKINYISYHTLLLHLHYYIFYYKIEKQFNIVEFVKNLINILHVSRTTYLKKHKLIGIEKDSILSELITNCKFNTIDGRFLHSEKIKNNMKLNKMYVFSYFPSKKKIQL
ncbi:hypothetical protein N9T73_00515, partial [bacterium]|nr:hypothetical protein [bacterium]